MNNLTYSQLMILQSEIKNELNRRFPYVFINVNKLAGENKASVYFQFSPDRQSTWENNDIENARNFIFTVTYKGEVECINQNCGLKINKFVADPNKILYKVTKVLDGIKTKMLKKQIA